MNPEEEILKGLTTGELSPEQEPARSLLENSLEFRRQFEALQFIEAGLKQAADERRAILSEIESAKPTASEELALRRARSIFEDVAPEPRPAPIHTRINPIPIGIAAAVLLSIGLWLAGGSGVGPTNPMSIPTTLGSELQLLAPVGPVQRYDEFRWEYALDPGLTFELTLWDETTGDEVWTTSRLRSSGWHPPAALTLPQHLRWEVWVLDPQGNGVTSGSSAAFLSR